MKLTPEEVIGFINHILCDKSRYGKCEYSIIIDKPKDIEKYNNIFQLFTSHGYKLYCGSPDDKFHFMYGPFGLKDNPANGRITVTTPIIPLAPDTLKAHKEYVQK